MTDGRIGSQALDGLGRRGFLKLGALSASGALLAPWLGRLQKDFPAAERLGRVCVASVDLKAEPAVDSATVGRLYEDAVVETLREVVGSHPLRTNQRFVETPQGYIHSPLLQPVKNQANEPVASLPETSLGPGMWVEVTVPLVNLRLANPAPIAPWLKAAEHPRFYYSQVIWVDAIETDEAGQVWYRLKERYGYGDVFWARAGAFRPIEPPELEAIRPDVEDKRIVVDVANQTMACYEGEQEVFFDRVSTGALYNNRGERVESWGTPGGTHRIWRKAVSLPLSGGSVEVGWDLPAVGWVSLFVGTGVAFHSTYWHNNYGVATSRGCVNCRPEAAKWLFRWAQPVVSYDPGDITVGMPGGTRVVVVDV